MPEQLQRTRSLMITYLDDELMVIRDESGAAEVLERAAQIEFTPYVSEREAPTPPTEMSAYDQPSDLEAE